MQIYSSQLIIIPTLSYVFFSDNPFSKHKLRPTYFYLQYFFEGELFVRV